MKTAEANPRGRSNDDGKLIYMVQTVCGSLPCPRLKAADLLHVSYARNEQL